MGHRRQGGNMEIVLIGLVTTPDIYNKDDMKQCMDEFRQLVCGQDLIFAWLEYLEQNRTSRQAVLQVWRGLSDLRAAMDSAGTGPESDPGADPEGAPGADPESDPSSGPESDPSADPEGDPGADPEGDPGAAPEAVAAAIASLGTCFPAYRAALKSMLDEILAEARDVAEAGPDTGEERMTELGVILTMALMHQRQKYWSLWLQNFFCEKLDLVIRGHSVTSQECLYVAVLPEFTIMDLPMNPWKDTGFFMPAVREMWQPGGSPGVMCRNGVRLVKTFCSLTQAYGSGNPKLLLVPGTTLWKIDPPGRTYYNTAMVFWKGKCIHVWDKQMISGEDGICHAADREHWQPGPSEMYASDLAMQYACSKISTQNKFSPVFVISPFGWPVRFGLTICLDASRPDFFCNDRGNVDIQLVLACGSSSIGILSEAWRIISKHGFLYCDSDSKDLMAISGGRSYCSGAMVMAYSLKPDIPDMNGLCALATYEKDQIDAEERAAANQNKIFFHICSKTVHVGGVP